MTEMSQLDELDRRRRLQNVELEVSRALLRRTSRPERALAVAFETVARALDVCGVTLLAVDVESVTIEAHWPARPAGGQVAGSKISRSRLPDLTRLMEEREVIHSSGRDLTSGIADMLVAPGCADTRLVAVPIVVDDDVIGALAVLSAADRCWVDEEIAFMESVACSAWGYLTRQRVEADLAVRVAEAELLARVGAMIAEPGPTIERDLVASILELLGRHIGASAVCLFERRGSTARPFAEWNPKSVCRFEPVELGADRWAEMSSGARTTASEPGHAVYPTVHGGEAIGRLVVVSDDDALGDHDRVVADTIELLRQFRIRALSERRLSRQREMEDLRAAISRAYVEADHWQVVETTVRALEWIGHAMSAGGVLWFASGIERSWTRDGDLPPARLVAAAELGDAARPADDDGGDRTVVALAGGSDPASAGLALLVPAVRRLTDDDLHVLRDIAQIIHEMEEWAALEAKTDEQRQQLQFQATHDDLTGLANRRLLLEELESALRDSCVAVLMIDMDRFKVINDSLGHTAGDAVLTAIADRLRLSVREPDLTCRFGGDEFAVMVPDAGGASELAALAQRLIEVAREPVTVRGTTVIPTCSVGIAVTAPGDDLESVLRHADAALYEAKALGRDRYEFFDDDHRESLRDRLALETSIRQGIQAGQFEPWYQPEMDLRSSALIGVEALIRWYHPTKGVLPASTFIDVAEEIGLAPEMSRIALRRGCQALAEWRRSGLETRMRVNVAAAQLQTGDLDEFVASVVAQHDIAPDQLCIEITERSLMLEIDASAGALRRLSRMGVEVAIDDFGTGFSSLGRLRGLPIDTLKIDRSFVAGLETNPTDRDIVRAILSLAKAVGLEVVAEGVERESQARILADLGCRRAQGWLWSGALPAGEIPRVLTGV